MSPRIQTIIDNALAEVRAALLEEASQAVRDALGGGGVVGNGRRTGGNQTGNGRRKPGPKPKAARAKGAKRTPEELEALTKTLLGAIKKGPGRRIEEIGKELGVATKELALPVLKLFEAKSIKSTGQRRATKYFPK